MSIFGDLWDSAKDVGSSLVDKAGGAVGPMFGTSKDAGILGTGQYKAPEHTIEKDNFKNPNSEADRQMLMDQINKIQNRGTPQMTASQLAPAVLANGAVATTSQSAPYQAAQTATLGPAANTKATTLNREQDNQARGYTTGLLSDLQSQAHGKGPGQELAENAWKQKNLENRNSALSLAASQRGNTRPSLATVMDAISNGQTANNQQLSADKLKAQLDAQSQIGSTAAGLRGADLTAAGSEAGLTEADKARNMAANNEFALTNFGANNDVNKLNANNQLNNQQFNTTQANTMAQFNTGQNNDISKYNSGQQNDLNKSQGILNNQAGIENLQASLKAQGMSDDAIQKYLSGVLGQDEANRTANEDYEKLRTQQDTGIGQIDSQAYQNAAGNRQSAVKGVAGAVAMSDKRLKFDIKPISIFSGMWN